MKKIFIPQLAIKNSHPKGLQCPTDRDYARIATEICSEFAKLKIEDIPVAGLKKMSQILSLYLEDVVADAGIWRGFTNAMKEKYGQYLPFYDLQEEEYFQDEPNIADVKLLIWYTMLEIHEGKVGNPENPILEKLANVAYTVLVNNFETAPINEELKDFFQSPQIFKDFYVMRDTLKWLCFSCYLTYVPYIDEILLQQTKEMILGTGLGVDQAYYIQECLFPFQNEIGPLEILPQEWLAMILRANGNDTMAKEIETMEATSFQAFKIVNVDKERNVVFEDEEGKSFALSNEDVKMPEDDMLCCAVSCFVKYHQTWYLNGTIFWSDKDARFEQQLKCKKEKDAIHAVYDRLLKENGGSPLRYFANTEELKNFLLEQLPKDNPNRENITLPGNQTNLVLYIPSNYDDFEIYPDAALSIKDERNPYYNQKAARNLSFNLALSVGTEMRNYLLSNHLLPDATINSVYGLERGNEIVQQNFDFIVRAVSSRL